MKKIGFIGAYDKIDLIIYVAKILTTLDKKSISNRCNNKSKSKICDTSNKPYNKICNRI